MTIQKKTVMLVEDTPADIALAEAAIAEVEPAHTCLSFTNGPSALKFLESEQELLPDLILLDLNLPSMCGREVLASLKSSATLKHIPVVILTTSSEPVDRHAAYAAHANCFITKPPHLEGYLTTVRNIMQYWFETVSLRNVAAQQRSG